jgi:diacylglycerol kinase family enzyme
MITNSLSVGGFKGITGNDVELDDGVFEVTLIKNPQNPIELNEILASLTNLIDDTEMIYSFKTGDIHFTSDELIPWTLDGEYGGKHDNLVIRTLKQRVNMIVPEEEVQQE